MGWNKDWSSPWQVWPSDVAEFMAAVNERHPAVSGVGAAPFFDPVAGEGDVVQTFAYTRGGGPGWLRRIQTWIMDYAPQFVVSHDAGVRRSPSFFVGKSETYDWTYDQYDPLSAVFSAAGLAGSHFPRYPNRGTRQTGLIAQGDILHHETLEYVQKALNVLVWTSPATSWTAKGENNDKASASDWHDDLDDAKDEAIARWGDLSEVNWYGPRERSEIVGIAYPETKWAAALAKRYAYMTADAYNGLNRDAAWFYTFGPYDEWDAYGESLDPNDFYTWQLWQTETPAPGNEMLYSTRLGNIDGAGTWVTDEGQWASGAGGRGWGTSMAKLLLMWDVAGGFEYRS